MGPVDTTYQQRHRRRNCRTSPPMDRDRPSSSDQGGDPDIWVMNADGSGQNCLTSNAGWDSSPSWSPDGSKIAFASRLGVADDEIYVMNADGSGQTNVTNDPSHDETAALGHPDGSEIIFGRTGPEHEVYVMDSDGSGWPTSASIPSGDSTGPDWGRPSWTRLVWWTRHWGVAATRTAGTCHSVLLWRSG